jgi:hypothetical protein
VIKPVLILDSRERWWPVGVEESCAAAGVPSPPLPDDEPLNFPPAMRQPELPVVGYHRVARGGGLFWQQFWTWWLYNPKQYAGVGEHEGDWEMVQLGCVDAEGDHPVLMTCSQHGSGEKREFWRVALSDDKRPLVHVARDSHANYFTRQRDVTDVADGQGAQLEDMQWRDFGPWASWTGRWGNSANSPGPLEPRRAWRAPHAYHGQARG